MPAKPLSPAQKADAERLRAAWEAFKSSRPFATQEWLADKCGWKTQGAVNQYLLGKIPLNLTALLRFCAALGVTPVEISPDLAKPLGETPSAAIAPPEKGDSRAMARVLKVLADLSEDELLTVAKALEALRRPTAAEAQVMKFKVGTPTQQTKVKR